MVDIHAPERIVSLLDPDYAFPETGPAYFNRIFGFVSMIFMHLPKAKFYLQQSI